MALVTFLGEVRRAAGRPEVEVEAKTVTEALRSLGAVIGPGFARLLYEDGSLQPDVEVLVNGRNIEFLRELETDLEPTDRVTIFYSGVRGFPGG